MGYELSIQRENIKNKITSKEWSKYIESDTDFEPIEEFSAELDDKKILTILTPNAGLWKSSKGDVPFTFYEKYGWISVKNPDIWVIEKMILIANKLNAVVLGEKGEKYDENYLKDEIEKLDAINQKKWWKFW